MTKRINIGSGRKVLKGWDNLDNHRKFGANVIMDLEKPLKIKSNTYDYVLFENTLEHMKDPLKVMEEIFRITKVGGKICVIVPYGRGVWDSIDHKKEYWVTTLLDLIDSEDFDSAIKGKVLSIRFKANPTRWFYYKAKVALFNFLTKIHPKFIDRTPFHYFHHALFLEIIYEKL
ncbi:MAG: methyltransferase domain-containing protein [Nanoarchaeota archaeon]